MPLLSLEGVEKDQRTFVEKIRFFSSRTTIKEFKMAVSKLKVTQKRSLIGQTKTQRAVVAGLGLRRIGSSVTVNNLPEIRGMIKRVIHLVEVEEV